MSSFCASPTPCRWTGMPRGSPRPDAGSKFPLSGFIAFEDGKISSEHIDWDQAPVLLQMGVLEDDLPALGAGQANRLLDPEAPANALIRSLAQV